MEEATIFSRWHCCYPVAVTTELVLHWWLVPEWYYLYSGEMYPGVATGSITETLVLDWHLDSKSTIFRTSFVVVADCLIFILWQKQLDCSRCGQCRRLWSQRIAQSRGKTAWCRRISSIQGARSYTNGLQTTWVRRNKSLIL